MPPNAERRPWQGAATDLDAQSHDHQTDTTFEGAADEKMVPRLPPGLWELVRAGQAEITGLGVRLIAGGRP